MGTRPYRGAGVCLTTKPSGPRRALLLETRPTRDPTTPTKGRTPSPTPRRSMPVWPWPPMIRFLEKLANDAIDQTEVEADRDIASTHHHIVNNPQATHRGRMKRKGSRHKTMRCGPTTFIVCKGKVMVAEIQTLVECSAHTPHSINTPSTLHQHSITRHATHEHTPPRTTTRRTIHC